MFFPHRYDRNLILTPEMQLALGKKKTAVIGLGGLGGFVTEELARFGVGHILGFDFDLFSETNLNRQLLCTEQALGRPKTETAAERVGQINSDIRFETVSGRLGESELTEALRGCDAVLDCLDSVKDRLVLERICERLDLPMVHGAIGGWYGQVSTIYPGDRTLERLYAGSEEPEGTDGNTVFTAALIASLQVSETVKLLTGQGNTLKDRILTVDLLSNDFAEIIL